MDNLENIKAKAEERGYSLSLRNANNSELFYSKDDIILILYPKIEGFTFSFYIDELVSLETIQYGSFMNDEYFKSMENNFIEHMNKLKL